MGGRTEAEHAPMVETDALRSPASIRAHPIHPMLIPMPIGLLVGALIADLLYAVFGDPFFAQMAVWLVGGGLLIGALAAVFGIVDFAVHPRARNQAGWIHAIGNGAVLVLALANLVWRLMAIDLAAAVLPWGLALSAVTGVLLMVTGWYGGELAYRYLIGVRPHADLTSRTPHREAE